MDDMDKMKAEITRLQAREKELLIHNNKTLDEKRAVINELNDLKKAILLLVK